MPPQTATRRRPKPSKSIARPLSPMTGFMPGSTPSGSVPPRSVQSSSILLMSELSKNPLDCAPFHLFFPFSSDMCHFSSSIFHDIIFPLASAWCEADIRGKVKDYLVVFKPNVCLFSTLRSPESFRLSNSYLMVLQVFPALFDWVAYPINLMIKELYRIETKAIDEKILTNPFHLELLASLERILCYCHTGSTVAFATSLMNGLGLSRGAVSDGFPMLHAGIFEQPTIISAMKKDFVVDPRRWPLKDKYPAVASKRTQTLTYSLTHFMVSIVGLYFETLSCLRQRRMSGTKRRKRSLSSAQRSRSIRGRFRRDFLPHINRDRRETTFCFALITIYMSPVSA